MDGRHDGGRKAELIMADYLYPPTISAASDSGASQLPCPVKSLRSARYGKVGRTLAGRQWRCPLSKHRRTCRSTGVALAAVHSSEHMSLRCDPAGTRLAVRGSAFPAGCQCTVAAGSLDQATTSADYPIVYFGGAYQPVIFRYSRSSAALLPTLAEEY